jgi:hypothetical protein
VNRRPTPAPLTRIGIALVSLITVVLGTVLATPAAANAASGCSWAPGGFGARQCLNVNGTGTYVNWERETYTTNWGGPNICRYQQAGTPGSRAHPAT